MIRQPFVKWKTFMVCFFNAIINVYWVIFPCTLIPWLPTWRYCSFVLYDVVAWKTFANEIFFNFLLCAGICMCKWKCKQRCIHFRTIFTPTPPPPPSSSPETVSNVFSLNLKQLSYTTRVMCMALGYNEREIYMRFSNDLRLD